MSDEEDSSKLPRRTFMRNVALASGGLAMVEWIEACKDPTPPAPPTVTKPPAGPAPLGTSRKRGLTTSHKTFTDEEFEVLEAAVDTVLPKDQDPGGVEAGVADYIDQALTDPDLSQMKHDFIAGMAALDRACHRTFQVNLAQAKPDQREQMLRTFATMNASSGEAHFYESLITLALEGFLGDPVYGGNKDRAGWNLIGFLPQLPRPAHPALCGGSDCHG